MSLFLFVTLLVITPASLPASLPASSGDTPYVVLPRNITALSGSCVQIPCTFNVSDFEVKLKTTEEILGCWSKTTHQISDLVFNSSGPIIKGFTLIEMVGNLSRRECSTVFYNVTSKHSDVYYFRVQMEPLNVFRYTFVNDSVNIKVLDVPKPPKLNDLPEVMEGTAVNLNCCAEAPCPKQPPTLSWTNIPKSANITTQLQEKPDKTLSVFSSMTFNASYMDHKMNISCTATYPRNISNNTTVNSTVMLQVLFSPKETCFLIEPNASVSVGSNVTLTCQSKANPSYDLNYTWYKRGEQEPLAFGKQMTFNVSKTNGGWYSCTAKNKHGAQTSEAIQLIVKVIFIVGSSESFIVPLIVGGVGGVFAFLLLCLLVTIFIRKQRTQASNVPVVREADFSDQDQKNHKETNATYTNSAFVTSEKPEIPKDEGDIHYGEINFTPVQTETITEKSSGQETVYAEVCNPGMKINQD